MRWPSPAPNSWAKDGMHDSAVAPSPSGFTGTSRQPRTVRPSSAAIVSIRETASAAVGSASVAVSSGRKAMPTA